MADVSPQKIRIVFRVGINFVGMAISLCVPEFVDVLSFVGCCCVACLGFTIPPFLHGVLHYKYIQRRKQQMQSNNNSNNDNFVSPFSSPSVDSSCFSDGDKDSSQEMQQKSNQLLSSKWGVALDLLMFAWGVFATVASTTYTFRQLSSRPS